MRKPGNNFSSVFEKALVAIVWILAGVGLACWGMQGVLSGKATRVEIGIWWDYFALIAGSGMVVTGICYYVLPRVKTYLDREAEELDLEKGKYRWFAWYTIRRFLKK